MGVYGCCEWESNLEEAKDIRDWFANYIKEEQYYMTRDAIGHKKDKKRKSVRTMMWETMKSWDCNVVDELGARWDSFSELLKRHPDVKIRVSSFFDSATYEDISQEHLKEIHKKCKGMTDEEIDEQGLVRYISSGEYKWNKEYNEHETFYEEVNSLDILM